MVKKATQEQRDFFIVDTLYYEVVMMRETHRLLRAAQQPQAIKNALIESFCIHARNLIEFFKNHRDCDFDPRWFANDGYRLKSEFVGKAVLSRIARQIAHISRDRIDLVHDKIDWPEQNKIKAGIEGGLARLHLHLKREYVPKWKVPPLQLTIPAPFSGEATTGTPALAIGWPARG